MRPWAHRVGLLALTALLMPAAAHASADAGARGEQQITYPTFHSSDPETQAPWMTVGDVGDVNGDGREDVGAGFSDGRIYVTFSSPVASSGDANAGPGFTMTAGEPVEGLSSAGDVNGDGLGDVVVTLDERTVVVYGRSGGEVDLGRLGTQGFTITGTGWNRASGMNELWENQGLPPLGDANGDGVPDLLVPSPGGAAVIFPSRDAAGNTIDATTPSAQVGRIEIPPDQPTLRALDVLGDVDRDGRNEILIGGESVPAAGQTVYGLSSPAPGEDLTTAQAMAQHRAFSAMTEGGSSSGPTIAHSVSDQNGDGRRDIAMDCNECGPGGESMHVVYTPAFGTTVDATSLVAADGRGWVAPFEDEPVDVGDQNGDGVGDIVAGQYVYFPDPAHELGTSLAWSRGIDFREPVVAGLADLNGDGRPEVVTGAVSQSYNNGQDPSAGESVSYEVDVFDSAGAPTVRLPTTPVLDAQGRQSFYVVFGSGAGRRADDVPVEASLELTKGVGPPHPASSTVTVLGSHGLLLPLSYTWGLVAGQTYRVRGIATNGRGRTTAGPWRSFVYSDPVDTRPVFRPAAQPKVTLWVGIYRRPVRLHRGAFRIRVACAAPRGHCRGSLRLALGRARLGARGFSILTGHSALVRVRLSTRGRRLLAHRSGARVLATARATGSGAQHALDRATIWARLR